MPARNQDGSAPNLETRDRSRLVCGLFRSLSSLASLPFCPRFQPNCPESDKCADFAHNPLNPFDIAVFILRF